MKIINIKDNVITKALILFIVIAVFSSCSNDVLNETPLDFISSSNAFTQASDVETGVIGLYALARNWYSNIDEKNMFVYVALGTDEAYSGEDPGGGTMCNWDTEIVPNGSLPQQYWTKAFDLVYQSNIVLKGINNIKWTDENQKNSYIAEAKFFRAFSYRILVTMFGDVPLLTEPVTTPEIDFVRTPKSSVYALIESDLDFAAKNLPIPGKEVAKGRLTQGAAWQMLSEIYLAEEEYQNAVDAATHVLNDYNYALMQNRFGSHLNLSSSENVYTDLFTMGNQNLSTNTEAIWVIQNEPNVVGGALYSGERAFGPAYYRMGNTPDGFQAILGELYNGNYTGYSNVLGRPVAWVRPTNYMTYDIWKGDWNDDRNTEANIKRTFYFDNPKSIYNGQKIDFSIYAEKRASALKDTTQYIFPYWMKVAAPNRHYTDDARSGGGYNSKDLYAMRLAETFLLRAEGYLGLSNKEMAAKDINTVRTRSHAPAITASDVTIDFILNERARELYTEEWRMLTLMRLGNLVDRVRKYNNDPENPGISIQDHQNLFPIPQSEIDLNTGAVLLQNPGYK